MYLNLGCFECKLERVFLRNENFGYIEKGYVNRNLIDCKSATVLDNEKGKKRVCFVCFAFLLLLRHVIRDVILARFDWMKFIVHSLVCV